jgi:hypothetical protein
MNSVERALPQAGPSPRAPKFPSELVASKFGYRVHSDPPLLLVLGGKLQICYNDTVSITLKKLTSRYRAEPLVLKGLKYQFCWRNELASSAEQGREKNGLLLTLLRLVEPSFEGITRTRNTTNLR